MRKQRTFSVETAQNSTTIFDGRILSLNPASGLYNVDGSAQDFDLIVVSIKVGGARFTNLDAINTKNINSVFLRLTINGTVAWEACGKEAHQIFRSTEGWSVITQVGDIEHLHTVTNKTTDVKFLTCSGERRQPSLIKFSLSNLSKLEQMEVDKENGEWILVGTNLVVHNLSTEVSAGFFHNVVVNRLTSAPKLKAKAPVVSAPPVPSTTVPSTTVPSTPVVSTPVVSTVSPWAQPEVKKEAYVSKYKVSSLPALGSLGDNSLELDDEELEII